MNNHESAIRNSRIDSNADCVKLHYTDAEHSIADLKVTICAKTGDLLEAEKNEFETGISFS